jgi:signal transduction histidine kinase
MRDSIHLPSSSSASLAARLAAANCNLVAESDALAATLKSIKQEWYKDRGWQCSCSTAATTILSSVEHKLADRQPVAATAGTSDMNALYERLQDKLQLQALLTEVSTRFMAVMPGDLGEDAGDIQLAIVRTLGIDRMTLWQCDDGHTSTVATHCWHVFDSPRVPPRLHMETQLPWAHAMIQSGRGFGFVEVTELPAEAERDADTFRELGCRSHVTLPLLTHKSVFGALSFDTLRRPHRRTWDEIAELKMVAQTIGNVIARQRAEQKADALRRELAHMTRVATLGGLAEGLAHELHQPLAAILSNAQAARRFLAGSGIDPDELRAILDDIVRDDKRAGGVIHNLRAMMTKRAAAREPCCMNEIVGEVVQLMHAELQSKHVEVRAVLAPDLPPTDSARVELQQVLLNLLVNAVQAMNDTEERDRLLEISTRLEGSSVVLCVADGGPGIPPERLAAVFEPFFSTKADGLGMGLSICRTIVENHGGHIEVRNRSGGGAEFTVLLPVC